MLLLRLLLKPSKALPTPSRARKQAVSVSPLLKLVPVRSALAKCSASFRVPAWIRVLAFRFSSMGMSWAVTYAVCTANGYSGDLTHPKSLIQLSLFHLSQLIGAPNPAIMDSCKALLS